MNNTRPTIDAMYLRIQKLAANYRHPSRSNRVPAAVREELQDIAQVAYLAHRRNDYAAVQELRRQAEELAATINPD